MARDLILRLFPPPDYLRLPAAGLDISDRAIKFCELKTERGKLSLGKFGEEEIPEGVVTDGVISDPVKLSEILLSVRGKMNNPFFYVSLPEEKAYIAEMPVPTGSNVDLREALSLHLEEQIPLDPKDAIFDFQTVHTPESSGTNDYIVAVSAVESGLALSYLQALGKASIIPLAFELESQALARSIVPDWQEGVVMVVDIGREQSNVSIISRNIVRLTSSISVGGNAFARAIKEDLKVTDNEAVKLKEEEGLFRTGSERSPFFSIVRVATVLRDEIYQRLSYWNTGRSRSNLKDSVAEVIICGGNANVPGLMEYLTSGIDVPVSIANPWVNILSFEDTIPELTARESLKYCTALGLALRVKYL